MDVRSEPAPARLRARIVGWVAVGIVALLVGVGLVVGTLQDVPAGDPGTPEGTVQVYAQAVIDGRWVEARDLLASDIRADCGVADFRNSWVAQPLSVRLEEVRTTDTGAEVEVQLRALAGPDPFGTDYLSTEVFDLVQEDGQWRLTGSPWPVYECRGW